MRSFLFKFFLATSLMTASAFAKTDEKSRVQRSTLSSGLTEVWNHVARQCRLIFLEPDPAPYFPTVTGLESSKSISPDLLKNENWWKQFPYPLAQKIHPFFRGEQYGAAMHPQFQNKKVEYLYKDEDRSKYFLHFQNGFVVDENFQRRCPDTCRGIYVMSSTGVIYFRDGQ